MNQNAEQPTVIVELNGDVFREEDLEASQEILEPQFRVEGEIYLTAIEEGFIGPIISGSIEIITSGPTRDILLPLLLMLSTTLSSIWSQRQREPLLR